MLIYAITFTLTRMRK